MLDAITLGKAWWSRKHAPQVVEEVQAGKPYSFSPPQEQNITQTAYDWKIEKNLLKFFFKEKDHGVKQEAKYTINFKYHCWGISWRLA